MDEISNGPKRDYRLPHGPWLVVAAAAGLIAVITALAVTGGSGRHAAPPNGTTPLAAPSPSPTAAPGTVLLTCDSANWSQLESNWQAGSLQAGPLWFVAGRQQGYVGYGGWQAASQPPRRPGALHLGVMIVEVRSGSTVVMKPAAAARSYFRFGMGSGDRLPAGATGFTFIACPRGQAGPNGQVTDFYLGFAMEAGRAAPVDVWPSATRRPIQVIFTCRRGVCEQ